MAPGKVESAGRMSSIELEPKTLTLDQLNYARDVALYVLSTETAEEAIRIFTEGLKPVLGVRKISAAADDDLDIRCFDSSGKACRRSRSGRRRRRTAVEKDVATAPF
ncbi:hypothetical protein ABZP36_033937 [Zizania latifolia]